MRSLLVVGFLCFSVLGRAAPPDLAEVPASLRVDPTGAPLTDAQKQALGERKILAQLVDDHGPEPWPGVAVAIIDAPPAEVFKVLRDYDHFPEFMPYVARATVDEHEGNRWLVSYVIKGPMGIGNREYQMEVFDEQGSDAGVTYLVSRFGYTGRGNIKFTQGTWKLVPIWSGTATFVRYEVRSDPGGSFTGWLKRKIASGGLPRIIEAVRKRLAKASRR